MKQLSIEGQRAIRSQEVEASYLYELTYDENEQPLRLCSRPEPFVWNGNSYQPFEISHSEISYGEDGRIGDMTLAVGNAEGIIQYYVEHYELILKPVRIIQVIGTAGDYIDITFVIKGIKAKKDSAEFALSIGFDVLKRTVPCRRAYSKFCMWRFKDPVTCKYGGGESTCDRSFDDCKRKGNLLNFGGFPGVINERIYI